MWRRHRRISTQCVVCWASFPEVEICVRYSCSLQWTEICMSGWDFWKHPTFLSMSSWKVLIRSHSLSISYTISYVRVHLCKHCRWLSSFEVLSLLPLLLPLQSVQCDLATSSRYTLCEALVFSLQFVNAVCTCSPLSFNKNKNLYAWGLAPAIMCNVLQILRVNVCGVDEWARVTPATIERNAHTQTNIGSDDTLRKAHASNVLWMANSRRLKILHSSCSTMMIIIKHTYFGMSAWMLRQQYARNFFPSVSLCIV